MRNIVIFKFILLIRRTDRFSDKGFEKDFNSPWTRSTFPLKLCFFALQRRGKYFNTSIFLSRKFVLQISVGLGRGIEYVA